MQPADWPTYQAELKTIGLNDIKNNNESRAEIQSKLTILSVAQPTPD